MTGRGCPTIHPMEGKGAIYFRDDLLDKIWLNQVSATIKIARVWIVIKKSKKEETERASIMQYR